MYLLRIIHGILGVTRLLTVGLFCVAMLSGCNFAIDRDTQAEQCALDPSFALKGRITNIQTKAPIAGAQIVVRRMMGVTDCGLFTPVPKGNIVLTAITDANGDFQGVMPAMYVYESAEITISATGYQSITTEGIRYESSKLFPTRDIRLYPIIASTATP